VDVFIHPGKQVFRSNSRRLAAAWLLPGTMFLGGCDADLSSTVPDSGYIDRVAVVVNRGDRTLTTIPFAVSEPPRTLLLGSAGVPGDLAVRGERALVTLGGELVSVDLRMGTVERRMQIVRNQEGQRVAFIADTLALVANPAAGTITPVNPQSGRVSVSKATAGVGPTDFLASGPRIYVLSSPPAPAVPSLVVLDSMLLVSGVIPLSGTNPRAMLMRGSLLYVLHAGAPGSAGGSLSIVDMVGARETGHVQGFGESPESMAFNSRGELFVSVPGRGLIVFNPSTRGFTPGPEAPLAGGGLDRVTRVAADPAGFVYALQPGACDRAGSLTRLNVDGTAAASVLTGICPVDVEFTALPRR
jgi:hypothetical protein